VVIALVSVWASLAITRPATIRVGPATAAVQTLPGAGASFKLGNAPPVHRDLGAGPLQLRLRLTLPKGATLLAAHEPNMLRQLAAARSNLVGVALGYLGRLAWHAVLLALALGFLVFRRRWRLALVSGASSAALLVTALGATAATMSGGLANVGSGSCARGWVSYVLPDMASLSPPAPPVRVPAAAQPAANPGLLPMLFVADDHLNPAGMQFALRLQRATGSVAVLDAGDITSFGVAGESCVVLPWVRQFHVPYVWVRGNHDSMAVQRLMAAVRPVKVLDYSSTTVDGIDIYGVGDPAFTPRLPDDSAAMRRTAETAVPKIVRAISAMSVPPDVVLVHDCRMAAPDDAAGPGVAGMVQLLLCGATHRYAVTDRYGTFVLHTATVGDGGLDDPSGGGFGALLLEFSASQPHRLVYYWQISSPGGPTPTQFVPHPVNAGPFYSPDHTGRAVEAQP
jgi:predicted phosphodiesterase